MTDVAVSMTRTGVSDSSRYRVRSRSGRHCLCPALQQNRSAQYSFFGVFPKLCAATVRSGHRESDQHDDQRQEQDKGDGEDPVLPAPQANAEVIGAGGVVVEPLHRCPGGGGVRPGKRAAALRPMVGQAE